MKELSLECYGNIWENRPVSTGWVACGSTSWKRTWDLTLEVTGGVNQERDAAGDVGIRSGENNKRKGWTVGKKAGCFHKSNLARLGHSLEGWTWGKMICKRYVRTKSWSWMLHWGVGHCRSRHRGVIWTLCVLLRWLCNGIIYKD